MNSTQAIKAAVEFIQRQITCEIIDGCDEEITEDHAHLQEVIRQLQQLPQHNGCTYGTLWSIDDLRTRRPSWSDEKLTEWMESRNGDLQDRQGEDGWEVIGYLLDDQDL